MRIISKIHNFYENLIDLFWEKDEGEDFIKYQVETYEDINPYQTVIDKIDELKIETAVGDEMEVDLSGMIDIDKLEEARDRWACECFSEDEDRDLYIPFLCEYLDDFLSDEFEDKYNREESIDAEIEKIITDELELDLYEINRDQFSMILYIYLKRFYDDPFDLLDKLKNYY